MPKPITKRQHEVLTFINEHIAFYGYAPTIREIAKAMSLCPSTVHEHVTVLVKKKRLKRHHRCSRALIVVKTKASGEAIEKDCAGGK